jgi:hypothetical protein
MIQYLLLYKEPIITSKLNSIPTSLHCIFQNNPVAHIYYILYVDLKQTPEFTKILTQGAHILTDALLTDRACNTRARYHPGVGRPRHNINIIFNISIARFYICIWSSAHYNYSRNWREADRGRLWSYKWRVKQPLLVHTSLMICPLNPCA